MFGKGHFLPMKGEKHGNGEADIRLGRPIGCLEDPDLRGVGLGVPHWWGTWRLVV